MTRRIAVVFLMIMAMPNLVMAAQKTPSQLRTETTLGYTANGVGAITGLQVGSTFTDVVDSFLPYLGSSSNCFWKSNGASSPATCVPIIDAAVVGNAQLKAETVSGKTVGYTIWRQGYSTAGDGGSMLYYFSSSACSISGGNDFTQVSPTTGTGCWIAYPSALGYDIRAAGAVAGDVDTYTTQNTTALTNIFADTTGTLKVITPEGIFRLPCNLTLTAASSLQFEFRKGTWKFDTNCSFASNVFVFTGDKRIKITGSGTIDLNNAPVQSFVKVIFLCTAYTASKTGCEFDGIRIVGGNDRMLYIAGGAQGGFTLSNFVVKNSYFSMTPGTLQNHCVLLTSLAGSGTIANPILDHNTCVGTSFQVAGTAPRVTNNDISEFQFGNAVFYEFGTTDLVTTNCYLAGNYFHDTGAGVDSNNTVFSGLEDNCKDSVVVGNYFKNLGGRGITVYTPSAYYSGNVFVGIGKGYNATVSNRAAIALARGSTTGTQAAKKVTLVGNTIQDDGATSGSEPAMLYGIYLGPGITGEVLGSGNVVNTNSLLNSSGQLVASRFSPIATATVDPNLIDFGMSSGSLVTGVSAFTFAPLDVAGLGTFKLSCRRLNLAAADLLQVQVSQDGGGTWKTAGTYVSSGVDYSNNVGTGYVVTTATGMQIGNTNVDTANAVNASFEMTCSNLGVAGVSRKSCRYTGNGRNVGTAANLGQFGQGYWNGDANAINGLRVLTPGGVLMTGICNLRGTVE